MKQLFSEIVEGAREAFFLAMLDGYAGGQNRKSTKTRSNDGQTKTVVFVHGNYVVTDEWHTSSVSDFSYGSTLITFDGKPVWYMSYGGWYNKEVVDFLKMALAENYKTGRFDGGRGPREFEKKFSSLNDPLYCLTYVNHWEGSMLSFRGDEYIYRKEEPDVQGNILQGTHHFFGGTILPV